MKTNKNKRRNKDIVKRNNLDNPINPQEAQNISDSNERLSGKDAKQARNKTDEGLRQGKEHSKDSKGL
jgi:hypothetical protein